MTKIGASEARTHLPMLLDRVSEGERITITRYGVPVAMLVPVGSKDKRDPAEFVEAMLEFRKSRRLGSLSVRDMVADGRRF